MNYDAKKLAAQTDALLTFTTILVVVMILASVIAGIGLGASRDGNGLLGFFAFAGGLLATFAVVAPIRLAIHAALCLAHIEANTAAAAAAAHEQAQQHEVA